ncbi:host specificity factor TipJ family phage tail protein [Roseateles sp. SL47]|uniref:host specificity factor TipJ family phage tail protein n=1 Tax=Roseateles sp. SL47 TaxID=2995138 RepID=UPI00226F7FAD|nr:host specificity factor TipJ family phage tail protein [Roseateles sp. SL47]WAC75372.1 host specificity factor TipJ family phage tail protein [Roseateles sp. SL47]
MLTIFYDPAGAAGHRCFDWDHDSSIQANIEAHLPGGGYGCTVYLNGQRIQDPGGCPDLDRKPSFADEVRVTMRPEGGVFGGVFKIISSVFSFILKPLLPKIPKSDAAGKDSPNNSLTGQSNVARAYQAIPDVYGYRRVWPDLIQPSTVQYIDHIKYVTEWMCISRGEGTISQVQYSETPIDSITGASYEIFAPNPGAGYPENRTTTLLDVLETFESDEVNGQELAYPLKSPTITARGSFNATAGSGVFTVSVPDSSDLASIKGLVGTSTTCKLTFTYGTGPSTYDQAVTVSAAVTSGGNTTFTFSGPTWSAATSGSLIDFTMVPFMAVGYVTEGPYTLPIECDRIRWNTVFLRGLKGTVAIDASWWQIDLDGVEVPGTRQTQTFSFAADTYDSRYWTTDVVPTAGYGRYRCEFTRKTLQIGDNGSDVAKLEELYAVRYYAQKVIPGVTVIRVTTKATTEATGFSDRKFNLRWYRHVRQFDSDELSTSRNFARAMAHIWTLAGNDVAELDTDALQEINDRLGEDSPLLRFDGSLDDADMSLGDRMAMVSNHARCVVWRDGTRWTVSRDEAKDVPELQFDYRNLAASGESQSSYSATMPDSNDGVEVEYVDETSQSKKAYVRLRVDSGEVQELSSSNPKKFQLPGCTTYAQAMNRAQLEARRILYQREAISDTALADAGSLGPGSLVRYIDPNDFAGDDGLQAGEVLSVQGNQILTSEPIDWKGAPEGRMVFTGTDGRLSSPVRCTPDGGSVVLESVPYGLYVADPGRQCGARYGFAVGLTEAEIESAGLYTLTSAKPEGDGKTVSIALARYDARLYEFDA